MTDSISARCCPQILETASNLPTPSELWVFATHYFFEMTSGPWSVILPLILKFLHFAFAGRLLLRARTTTNVPDSLQSDPQHLT